MTALRDAVALVTGGSRGLGFLVARELGRAGASVVLCGRDPAALQRARATLARDADVHAVPCDVTDFLAATGLGLAAVRRFQEHAAVTSARRRRAPARAAAGA